MLSVKTTVLKEYIYKKNLVAKSCVSLGCKVWASKSCSSPFRFAWQNEILAMLLLKKSLVWKKMPKNKYNIHTQKRIKNPKYIQLCKFLACVKYFFKRFAKNYVLNRLYFSTNFNSYRRFLWPLFMGLGGRLINWL